MSCRTILTVQTIEKPAALQQALADTAREVDVWLAQRIDVFKLPENLRSAVAYAALGPGKRLRPIVTLWACEAVGGERCCAMPAAAALEMIHAFSLVHDDLPAMDDDDLRRGRPTLHRHTSEAMAILAGDALFALAVQTIADSDLDDGRKSALIAELMRGTTAMIIGQVYDTLGGLSTTLEPTERLREIHMHKTAALFRTACRCGAISGSAENTQIEAMSRHGEAIGLMFQAVDDLLDVTQTAEHTGKATGKDMEAGKFTAPALLGVEGTKQLIHQLESAALGALSGFGQSVERLRQLCGYMASRTR